MGSRTHRASQTTILRRRPLFHTFFETPPPPHVYSADVPVQGFDPKIFGPAGQMDKIWFGVPGCTVKSIR